MSNIDNGFAVEILSLSDQTLITSGTSDPRLVGYEAPEGSLFAYKNGTISELLIKKGPADIDWVVNNGFTGSQGVQGATGATGFTGSQGIQGVTGFTGSRGFTGSAGFTGSQGIQGVAGFTGSAGSQGATGFTGSQGVQGVTGFTGSQGIQGVTGFTGSQGATGATGFTGSRGANGFTGSAGSQGIQGVIGFTGSAGFTGSQGIQGVTGFTGSVGFAVLDDLNDVTITTPSTNQTLVYDGLQWVNSSVTPSSRSGVLTSWTLISGTTYYADFAHNLGTNDVVISLYNNTTNQLVFADSVDQLNVNTVRVTVTGNTTSVRIVVVANGAVSPAGLANVVNSLQVINAGGSPSIMQDLISNRPAAGQTGRLFLSTDTKILFRDTGSAWDILTSSQGVIRTLTFYANSLDSPTNSDFIVNALAPTIADPLRPAFNVRSFSNTVEQGVSFMITPPLGATTITFKTSGRSSTAPGGAANVVPRIYIRSIPNNAAVSAWSSATDFSPIAIPTNTNFQYQTQSFDMATLGLTVGTLYQVELTRKVSGVTNNLAFPWYLVDLSVEFT